MCETQQFSTIPSLAEIRDVVSNPQSDIVEKMRHLFDIRHHGGTDAVALLQIACKDPSVLVAHEAAYLLGQLREPCAIPFLISLLADLKNHCMVRHEAAEALAAIGELDALKVLKEYVNDVSLPVKETCILAVRSLQEKARQDYEPVSRFNTVDPIVQTASLKQSSFKDLATSLHDESRALWDRYESLFALRDMGTIEAYYCIGQALKDGSSALFRHEVAFVLGQIQCALTVEPLVECLGNKEEHSMARHEAALALGSLGTVNSEDFPKKTKELILETLQTFCHDPDRIVAESCLVALDNIQQERGCSI